MPPTSGEAPAIVPAGATAFEASLSGCPVSRSQRSKRLKSSRYLARVLSLPAMLPQDGQEALIDFAERRRGICGLVHVEAPRASADLV